MTTLNFKDLTTDEVHSLTDTTWNQGPATVLTSGASSLNIDTTAVAGVLGYYGDRRAQLMHEVAASFDRTVARSWPTRPSDGTHYQTSAEVDGEASFTCRWYWQFDDEDASHDVSFSGDSETWDRIEEDWRNNSSSDALRLHKRGAWIDVSADRYVRLLFADPTLALAAFEVYEHASTPGRRAVKVTGPTYKYATDHSDAFPIRVSAATLATRTGYSTIASAWAAPPTYGEGSPPYIGDIMISATESLPPTDYTRKLVLLTEAGVTTFTISEGNTFDPTWISALPTFKAPQPKFAPMSYTAQIGAIVATKLLPRYGAMTAFNIGTDYLYVGKTKPAAGTGPASAIVARSDLASRLPNAVPGYPTA